MTLSPVQYHCAFSCLLLATLALHSTQHSKPFYKVSIRPALLHVMLRNRGPSHTRGCRVVTLHLHISNPCHR